MIYLKPVQDDELELTMAWRSSPLVYKGMYQQKGPLTWSEHIEWFYGRNKDWRHLMIWYTENPEKYGPRRVGVVTIGQLDHWSPEIGYYIGEISLWGQGCGKESVRQGLKYILDYGRTAAHTTIRDDNIVSIKLIGGLRFTRLGPARPGESWYQNLDIAKLLS